MKFPKVCLGGSPAALAMGESLDQKSYTEVIEEALGLGISFFDTASAYANGQAEVLLGKAIRGKRDKVIVASKVSTSDYKNIKSSCERSLKNLGTDYLDGLATDSPQGYEPQDKLVSWSIILPQMLELKREGKIREIGFSNCWSQQLHEVEYLLPKEVSIGYNQVPYALHFRTYEHNHTIQHCNRQNIPVVTYMALGQGVLTGNYTMENRPDKGDSRSNCVLFQSPYYENTVKAVELLKPIAERYGATLAELVLCWQLSRSWIDSVVIEVRSADQLRGLIKGSNFVLDHADVVLMEKIGHQVALGLDPRQRNPWDMSYS